MIETQDRNEMIEICDQLAELKRDFVSIYKNGVWIIELK